MLFNYLEAYDIIPWPDLRYMFGEVRVRWVFLFVFGEVRVCAVCVLCVCCCVCACVPVYVPLISGTERSSVVCHVP